MDISANININNHRMNTRGVNPFACPQAGHIGNNVREPARPPIQPRTSPRITKFRLSRAAWKSFLTYFRHGFTTRFRLFPRERAANLILDYFPPAVRCTVVARSTVRTFVSATFQPRKPVEPYFRRGAPPGRARTNLIRKLRFDMWSACRTRAQR